MADGKVTVIARIKAKPGLEETVKKEVMNLVSPTALFASSHSSRERLIAAVSGSRFESTLSPQPAKRMGLYQFISLLRSKTSWLSLNHTCGCYVLLTMMLL